MRFSTLSVAMRACAAVALSCAAIAPATAQVPPPSSEAADIAACLCLQRAIPALEAAMTQRGAAFEASRQEVANLDAQLQSGRATINVDSPDAVAQFRQLLERRDAAFRNSSGPAFTQYSSAVALYNDRVNEFNARCAGRPRNPALLNQVQATLVCPPVP
jgi:hypothetical protein